MVTDFPNLGNARGATPNGWRLLGGLLALYALLVVLAAISSVALVRFGLPHLPPAWAEVLTHRGLGKIMARMMELWLLVLIPLALRFSGWRGWRDCGWQNAAGPARPLWQDLLAGLALGVATLGTLALFMVLTGRRDLTPLDSGESVALSIVSYALSAIGISVFEETVARGVIFRLWARAWGVLIAALFSSAVFALAHFLAPDPAAFQRPGFWQAVGALGVSALQPDLAAEAFWIRLLNLALLGLTLCAMVCLTGRIWFAVGAHAGWVWSIKLNSHFTGGATPSLIWGVRGDMTDSVIGTTTLFVVLVVLVCMICRSDRRGKCR